MTDEETDESTTHDEETEARQLLRGVLEQIRAQVHPQSWQAFWKVVVEGKTPEQVGEELAMRPGTVRVAKSRVLSRFNRLPILNAVGNDTNRNV